MDENIEEKKEDNSDVKDEENNKDHASRDNELTDSKPSEAKESEPEASDEKSKENNDSKKKEDSKMNKKGKEGSFKPIVIVMVLSLVIAGFWDKIPAMKNAVNFVLDPTAGALLGMNLTFGMFVLVFIISLITTLIQKYATDQETLRELKKEQKILQGEMKKYKEHPEKLADLQKKQLEFIPKTMKLSMRPIMYTGVPFILLFRWFMDYFTALGDVKFLGFLSWFWFYLIFAMVFGGILRKALKIV